MWAELRLIITSNWSRLFPGSEVWIHTRTCRLQRETQDRKRQEQLEGLFTFTLLGPARPVANNARCGVNHIIPIPIRCNSSHLISSTSILPSFYPPSSPRTPSTSNTLKLYSYMLHLENKRRRKRHNDPSPRILSSSTSLAPPLYGQAHRTLGERWMLPRGFSA